MTVQLFDLPKTCAAGACTNVPTGDCFLKKTDLEFFEMQLYRVLDNVV